MPCPDGLEREDGRCVSTFDGPPGEGVPPTEADFLDRFDDRACDALEDCWCETFDVETCDDADVECARYVAPVGCVYDELKAQECLSGRFSCEEDVDRVVVTAPDACSLVYDCAGGSGS